MLAVGWWSAGPGPRATHPLAIVSDAVDLVHEGVARFAVVVLPFDPIAEPGLHAVLLAGISLWLLALALVWLVAAWPLADRRPRRAARRADLERVPGLEAGAAGGPAGRR